MKSIIFFHWKPNFATHEHLIKCSFAWAPQFMPYVRSSSVALARHRFWRVLSTRARDDLESLSHTRFIHLCKERRRGSSQSQRLHLTGQSLGRAKHHEMYFRCRVNWVWIGFQTSRRYVLWPKLKNHHKFGPKKLSRYVESIKHFIDDKI